VYFASTVGANYQVGMWLAYFVRIGRPFIIVTRTAPMLAQIGRLCEEQGSRCPSSTDGPCGASRRSSSAR
jgi:hypothetical protein